MFDACEAIVSADDRDRWLSARRRMITASDVAGIAGESPWRPAIAVWAEKTNALSGNDPNDPEPEYLSIGRTIEPWLLDMLAERARMRIDRGAVLLRSKRWPWLGCTLDGEGEAIAGGPVDAFRALGRASVEVKTSGGAFADEWTDGAPEVYRLQLDAQLAVTGARWTVIGALLGGRGFRYRWAPYARDERRIARVVEMTRQFWENHVEADVPPEPDGSDEAARVLEMLYPGSRLGAPIELGADALELVAEYERARTLEGDAKRLKETMKQQLVARLGNATAGRLPNGRIVTWKEHTRAAYKVQASTFRKIGISKGPKL
jgi:putative phage-type endonuclease